MIVRCWNCGNDMEVLSSARDSNQSTYTHSMSDADNMSEMLDIAYWQGYNNAMVEISEGKE